jgi:LysM repeat protein
MSALVVHPAWGPAPGSPARRRSGGPVAGRGNLQLVGPGFVPAVVESPARRPGGRQAVSRPASSPTPLRLTVRGRRVVTTLALIAATGASVTLGGLVGLAANPSPQAATTTVTVAAGETLWSLASATAVPGEDPRDIVEQITALNGLASSDLVVGQELLVPAE